MSAIVVAHLLLLKQVQLVVAHILLIGKKGRDVAVAEVGWHIIVRNIPVVDKFASLVLAASILSVGTHLQVWLKVAKLEVVLVIYAKRENVFVELSPLA